MTYTLAQLLENKDLRKSLAEGTFTFTDHNGVFDLDFQEKSMRLNHRAAFDRLYELGGEELLAKLLTGGKTCLTDTKEKGLSPIQGTDRFFLKTNAGLPTAFTSILFGIEGWAAMSSDFDADGVVCQSGEEDTVPAEAEAEAEVDEEEESLLPPHYNVSLIQKDGKFSLYDNDENTFITLPCEDAPDGRISSMLFCEPLMAPPCREDQTDNLDGEAVQLGWKYKLTEYGSFGWISEDCTVVSAPIFKKLEVHCDGSCYCREEMSLLAWSEVGIIALYCSDGWSPLTRSFGIGLKSIPDSGVYYERDGIGGHLLTWKEADGGLAGYVVPCEDELYSLSFRNGVLKLWKNFELPQSRICTELTLNNCLACFTFKRDEAADPHSTDCIFLKPSEHSDLCLIHETTVGVPGLGDQKRYYYALRRNDLYWGIVEVDACGTVRQPRTPFAFTHIRPLKSDRGLAAVEQFGKWGVYDVCTDKYIIPCEYEEITASTTSCTVHKAGFEGQINFDGKWVKHLHR